MLRSCLLILLLVIFLPGAEAGDTNPARSLGIENGLSNNAVTCIFRDHNGFMWFGTYDGLNRYDGYSFRIFRNIIGDSNSLIDNHIYTITGDEDHNLWIGCSKGIGIYNPVNTHFSTVDFKAWDRPAPRQLVKGVGVIKSMRNGAYMLAGTQGNGLLFFGRNRRTAIQIPLQESQGWTGDYTVTAIENDLSGRMIWVFIPQKGLYMFNAETRQLLLVNSSIKQADCLKADSSGNLWLGNGSGLYRYDYRSNIFSENLMPAKNRIAALVADRHGNLWIGSDGGGLWWLPAGSGRPVPYLSSSGKPLVNSNAIYAIYEDPDERKWIGTLRGGVNILQASPGYFKHITYSVPGQDNNINNFILSFCEDEKNNVWIGTDGAGLRYWNRKNNSYREYVNDPEDKTSLSSNFVTGILCDSRKDIWISTWFGGINRFNSKTHAFERYSCFNPETNAVENNAWMLFEDAGQRIWASTTNNGTLYLLNRKTNAFELFDNRLINIQCLAEDSHSDLWAGNYTSLIRIDRVGKNHQIINLGYPVRCIHEDRSGNFWVGTEGGGLLLFNRATGSYKRFSTSDGLSNNSILRMLEDDKGNLWLSTYNGLCKFNILSKTCRNFSQSDGLQSNQFSFNAALALKSGEFLFGGIRGFNIFYPDSVYDKKEVPPVFLTGIRISNTPVEQLPSYITKKEFEKIEQITLPFDRAILSLDFTALEFSGTDKLKYAYLLEGWDKDWNYVDDIRSANYSRLQEGNYTFKVKATNADGLWGREIQLLKVTVLPPAYRTWWAYICYALIFASAIYLYIIYNKRKERLRYEIKLAHIEKEKEKELMEKKISFFTNIAHEFRTPLTLIINPLKELMRDQESENNHRDISMIFRNARRLLSLVDQLLLFRKAESVQQQMSIERFGIVETCNEVCLSFSQHAVVRQIRFVFDRDQPEIFIYGDKQNIEIILFNLVSNAFKYTAPGGQVQMEIKEEEKNIEIAVRDNGIGIPAGVNDKLFESFYQAGNKSRVSQAGFGVGLYVSRKLAQAHYGDLLYSSREGEGTEFRLRLLKGKDHFASASISEEDHLADQTMLQELVEEPETESAADYGIPANESAVIDKLSSGLPTMVIIDDSAEIRSYLCKIFSRSFNIFWADDGSTGYKLILKHTPDIVISDIRMKEMGGIELCKKIKGTDAIAHIPVILLTGSSSEEIKLEGIEGGAEDYITKPFDSEMITARVRNILRGRNRLQEYFFNAITLKPAASPAGQHKEFIERCIAIVENHLQEPDFTIPAFCKEIGMSHPSLYKKVKAVSGLTVNVFIRYLRLRKAAELLINTNKSIVEITYITGFNDIKYFRSQFHKLFEMNPSDYIKRYRKVLGRNPALDGSRALY